MSRPDQKQPSPRMHDPGPDSVDYAAWKRSVEETLGDVSFDDALGCRASGGSEIEPRYTSESPDFGPSEWPGRPPFTRGASAADAGWRTAQEIAHPWTVEAAEAMRADQQRGVRLLWLRMGAIVSPGGWELETATDYDGVRLTSADDVEKLLAVIEPETQVVLESGEEALATAAMWIAAARRQGLDPQDLHGSFGCDPLADLIGRGRLHGSLDGAFRQLAELATWSREHTPQMRSALVSTSRYHDAGADAVQELAFALSTGVCYLRGMTAAGLDPGAAAAQLDFSFSVGRDFFLEIAKLRAARPLWSKVLNASGIGGDARAMRIHARTSALETSRLGPWMNLVRGGAQSFAAALGGAGSIRTAPWDEALGWPDDHGRRLAVSVQHILAEEAHLDRVVDAGGGSWYLESMTDQLARRAWDLFRELEGEGGMARAVVGGTVAEQMRSAAERRRRSAATRQAPIIGASAFADLAEGPFAPKLPVRDELPRPAVRELAEESGSISIQDLLDLEDFKLERGFAEVQKIDTMLAAVELSMEAPGEPGELMELSIAAAATGARGGQILEALTRGSEPAACDRVERFRPARPFERLRAASDGWRSDHGRRPRILLLHLEQGDGTERRAPDAAFVRRLFAAGGVESIDGGAFTAEHVKSVAQRFAESRADAAAILAEEAPDAEFAGKLTARLEALGAAAIFLGCRPGEHEATLRDAGVDGFVYDGCDVQALLASLHERLQAEASS